VDGIDYRNSRENQEFLAVSKKFLANYADSFNKVLVPGSIFEMPKYKSELHDDTNTEPRCRYSESKVMLHDWMMQNRINYSWPIIPYVVSAKDPEFKLIPTILGAAKKPELAVPLKSPKLERNFIHVRECASIIVACLNKDVVGRYLIGSETDITSAELVEEFKLHWKSSKTEDEEKEFKQKLVFCKMYSAFRGKKVTNRERASQLRDLILQELRT
jgi:nucleoside-diphosphate-sugar epimerase